jgi:hypothetical protein
MFMRTILWKRRTAASITTAMIFGSACAVFLNMRSRGFASAEVTGIPVACAALFLAALFFLELVWPRKKCSLLWRPFVAAARTGACLLVIVSVSIWGAMLLPDAAFVYFLFNHSYIDAHWTVDPVTKFAYFPIDYERDESGSLLPLDFFVLDKENKLTVDSFSNAVTSPSCPRAEYTAYRVSPQVYAVRQEGQSPNNPCLITPSSLVTGGRRP